MEAAFNSLLSSRASPYLQWFFTNLLQAGPIPQHVAFIMDGNRRFAKAHQVETVAGHTQGGLKLQEMLGMCKDLGITTVTAFAFSLDNFKRSKDEVDGIMNLAIEKLIEKIPDLVTKTRVRVFGNISLLPLKLQTLLAKAIDESKTVTSSNFNLCFAYTSTDEIIRAAKKIVSGVQDGLLEVEHIDHKLFDSCLDSVGLLDPDIVVRTSGEVRLSDFLLWQSAFSCVYFCPVLWPDFTLYHLYLTIFYYQQNFAKYQETKILKEKYRQAFIHSVVLQEEENAEREKKVLQFQQQNKTKDRAFIESLLNTNTQL